MLNTHTAPSPLALAEPDASPKWVEMTRSGAHVSRRVGGGPSSGPTTVILTDEDIESAVRGFDIAKADGAFPGGLAPVGVDHSEFSEALAAVTGGEPLVGDLAGFDQVRAERNADGGMSLMGLHTYTDVGRSAVLAQALRGYSSDMTPPGLGQTRDGTPIAEWVPFGGTLTNRPFVRGMEAVAASEGATTETITPKEAIAMASPLGDRLKSLRDEKELSNEDLAKAAGIDVSTMGSILSGEISAPPIARLNGLGRLLGVSGKSLLNLIPSPDQDRSTGETAMSDLYAKALGLSDTMPDADRFAAVVALRDEATKVPGLEAKNDTLTADVAKLAGDRDTLKAEVVALTESAQKRIGDDAVAAGRISLAQVPTYLKAHALMGEEYVHSVHPAQTIATAPIVLADGTVDEGAGDKPDSITDSWEAAYAVALTETDGDTRKAYAIAREATRDIRNADYIARKGE